MKNKPYADHSFLISNTLSTNRGPCKTLVVEPLPDWKSPGGTPIFDDDWWPPDRPICKHPRSGKRIVRMEPTPKAEGDYPFLLMCFKCGHAWVLDSTDGRVIPSTTTKHVITVRPHLPR